MNTFSFLRLRAHFFQLYCLITVKQDFRHCPGMPFFSSSFRCCGHVAVCVRIVVVQSYMVYPNYWLRPRSVFLRGPPSALWRVARFKHAFKQDCSWERFLRALRCLTRVLEGRLASVLKRTLITQLLFKLPACNGFARCTLTWNKRFGGSRKLWWLSCLGIWQPRSFWIYRDVTWFGKASRGNRDLTRDDLHAML